MRPHKSTESSNTREQHSNYYPPSRPRLPRPTREVDRSEWSPTRPRPTSAEVLVSRPAPKVPSSTPDKPRYPSRMPYGTGRKDGSASEVVHGRTTRRLGCWHFLMILSNIVMLVGGMTVFVLGAWMIFDNTFAGRFIGVNLYLVTVYVLLGCGFVSVCIGVIGCVGAFRAAKCLIMMYMILTVAILLTMLAGVFTIVLYRNWVKRLTDEHMHSLLASYSVNSVIRDAWDTTQQYLKCCGVNSSADWPKGNVPASCCNDNHCRSEGDIYQAGCMEETEQFFDLHVYNFVAAFIGVQLIMLFGLITSCGYYKYLVRYGE